MSGVFLLDLHAGWSWMAVVGNGLAGAWALVAYAVVALRTRALWWFTAAAQVAVFVQVVLGVLLITGKGLSVEPFHIFYGFVACVSVGIISAYRAQLARWRELLYGLGGLFIMGLGIRAMLLGAPG